MEFRNNTSAVARAVHSLLCMAAGSILLCGCVPEQARSTAVSCNIIVPPNMMTGSLWDVEPLSKEELARFLAHRLPRPDEACAQMWHVEAFESLCGKRVVWIPAAARPSRALLPMTYGEICEYAKLPPDVGPVAGEFLEGLLATLTPGHVASSREGAAKVTDEDCVYTAIVTSRNVLILLVPRDHTRRSIPENLLPRR